MFQTKTLKFTTSINKLIKQKLKFVTVCTVLLVSDWLCALYCYWGTDCVHRTDSELLTVCTVLLVSDWLCALYL
jgi:hypothetical protein